MKLHRKLAVFLLLAIFLIGLSTGCRRRGDTAEPAGEQTIADFETATIGIMTGSSHDGTVKTHFPKAERMYFSSVSDMVLAVEQGKIDCYIEDAVFLPAILWTGANVTPVTEPVATVQNGFAFPQTEESRFLREQINAFIAACAADGTLEYLQDKWLGSTEPAEHPDILSLEDINGTIHLAAVVDSKPIVYLKDHCYTGMEIDFLTRFGEAYGYAFTIEAVPFPSLIAGLSAGKYDMAASSLNITKEREESVDFSVPYSSFDVVLVVKGDGTADAEKTLEDFEHATIGIMTGTAYDPLSKQWFPHAKREFYSLLPDLILAVEQEKVDGFITERPYAVSFRWEGADITTVREPIAQSRAGFIFPKTEASAPLQAQLNAFIAESNQNGFTQTLQAKWFGDTEPSELSDPDALTGENGTLRVAIAPDLKPISYYKDGVITGYEVEYLVAFAEAYGYALDIESMGFDAILPGVTTGKYDIGTGAITYTDERAESLDFSDSHLTVDVVMVIAADSADSASSGFWTDLKENFDKTMLRENRWLLIAEGVGVTTLISLCAIIFGTLLGFGLYLLRCSEVKLLSVIAAGIARVYSRIVAGTPVVVVLMILFYVVFGAVRDLSGIAIAILGFSLTFGAFVYDHMTVSMNSVDRGQTEAAYALGYPKKSAFYRILLPQAMSVFLPPYCGQAVELIKSTAIVGYIAVNDLTKMGDIIRSNTYEAFFPLIITAVMYFLLTWLLSLLLRQIRLCFEPHRRSKAAILKGVKLG